MVNPPNVDTAGRFVRTHQALSMRVGKGKATSDMVHGSNEGSEEEETASSVEAERSREKERELVTGLWSGSVGWELGDQLV